ncbi:RNA polymerase sigma factor [Shewanella sp. 3_MG-2023]|uniref:RNA polymerase sigma factor n=1 Tax=Shewanella sp. 3_MG-2023 TaxID=3062635 RepID=UPI0026E1BC72|nr:RNA polymerase sigma factor [Shewanella sp. 3_MG-2023]MDO6775520.1 RNA polymerase sigma factor [Shewanella sp. 3_MG-2023]
MNKDKLLEAFWPRLSRIASTYEAIPQLQQELVQEMAMAIWLSLNSFRGDSSVETFMYKISHNVGVGHIKKQVKQVKTTSEDYDIPVTFSLEKGIANDQQLDRLMSAIWQLPLIQRQIITLYLDGVKQQNIAEIVGMSENNIAVKITRTKKSLARLMSND